MDEASHESQESGQGKPDVKQVKKGLDTLWCHLCRIEFKTCEEFCMHIMKKHRPSSKYYEGCNENENSKVQKDHPSETVQDVDNSEDFSVSSHEISEKSGNNKWLNNSSGAPFAVPETFGMIQIGKGQDCSSSQQGLIYTNPILHNFANMQNSTSYNSQLNPFVNRQSANDFFVGSQVNVPKIKVNSVINEQIMQQKRHLQFPFNSKNILKWNKGLKDRFQSLQFPLPLRILKCIKGVSEILVQFCMLSPDEEAVFIVQKILKEMEDILQKHNMQII